MTLVDTSVWVDHLRKGNDALRTLLLNGDVMAHPFVAGELACGSLKNRDEILRHLQALPQAPVAEHGEVMSLLESKHLWGRGIGWIDAHLIASSLLARARIWTLDKSLAAVTSELKIGL